MTTAPLPPAPPSDIPPSDDPPSDDPPSDDPPSAVHQPWVAPARPQLRRSGSDRMIGGVSGGLADYTGIDPVLWRVGFVALTLAGGSGILVYLFLWILTPADPLPADITPSPVEQLVQRLHRAISGAMAAVRRD